MPLFFSLHNFSGAVIRRTDDVQVLRRPADAIAIQILKVTKKISSEFFLY